METKLKRNLAVQVIKDHNIASMEVDYSGGGDKIDLVKELFNIDYSKAVFKIGQDYNKFITDKGEYTQSTIKPEAKYKVDSVVVREWNNYDKKFWLQFNIGEDMLNCNQNFLS